MLNNLPPPPPCKNGWPWTEESDSLPPFQPDNKPWPRISIITPSFNHEQFIEETIRSVLLQNYPNLEYLIIDGKSSDNTIEIIRKYEPWINYWVSEPDNSQSHAINKGFYKCTGELVNWICSDDMLCKNSLHDLVPEISGKRNALYTGRGIRIDRTGKIIDEINPSSIKSLHDLVDIGNFWRNHNSIMQQSCLFPLEEVKKAGYLNEINHYTMDYELWGRFLMNKVPVISYNINVGIFRWYGGQKTSELNNVTNSLVNTAILLIRKNNDFSVFIRLILRFKVLKYIVLYIYHSLRSKIGLKRKFKSLMNVRSGIIYF